MVLGSCPKNKQQQKNICLLYSLEDFSSVFSSRCFLVFPFMFGSMVILSLFLHMVWGGDRSVFFSMCMFFHVDQQLLKRLSFRTLGFSKVLRGVYGVVLLVLVNSLCPALVTLWEGPPRPSLFCWYSPPWVHHIWIDTFTPGRIFEITLANYF